MEQKVTNQRRWQMSGKACLNDANKWCFENFPLAKTLSSDAKTNPDNIVPGSLFYLLYYKYMCILLYYKKKKILLHCSADYYTFLWEYIIWKYEFVFQFWFNQI